jgi:cobalt/nickel transport system permease protein
LWAVKELMHIPDGFLTANTWAPAWVISIGSIGFCLKKTTQILKERMVPLMGIMSAFIFAAQMINFPVLGGTSGHLLGGVLAAVLLGPYAGAIVLTCVLIFQCLIFQDGGLLALGANILNMAIIGTLGGYIIFNVLHKIFGDKKGFIIGAAVASWFSVVIAASFCALELAISGLSPLSIVLPVMAGIHALIGIGEALITVAALSFIQEVRPDLIYGFVRKTDEI